MIRTETDGPLRVVTLDRPDRRNALDPDGLDALSAAVEQATEPVVYLHGAGEAFCAGADLSVVSELDREEAVAFAEHGQQVARTLETYDGVVVAGIDGAARGGGVELALACDIRVGTPEATLSESGVSLGLFGAWGGTARLSRIVGETVAMDISLSGRVLSGTEAREVGLLSRVVEEPRAVATEIAANDAGALRTIKQRIRDDDSVETQETRAAAAFGNLIADSNLESVSGE
ncbi:enoyl-CoA hydratase/isomerase family protein [Halovenus salina]|uniref:Enoyl-CoA hydratase/isomerase family protein n=1 Tax=Halovenus salina TaxID=1510225 RepID=A0ABD5W5J1_9EURY|nr:enoyl-CoA hydratase/isomerase family protein [Halovenus salina]